MFNSFKKGYHVDQYPTKLEEFVQDGKKFKYIDTLEPIMISKGSFIKFYVNGKDQGVAFQDLISGKYYPGISLFGGAQATIFFDRNLLTYPPKDTSFSTFQ